jgi:hypothetical protein
MAPTSIATMSASNPEWESVVHGVRVYGETRLVPDYPAKRRWTHAFHVAFHPFDQQGLDQQGLAQEGLERHELERRALLVAPPGAELIAHQQWEGQTEYAFYRRGTTLSFTFPGFCEGEVDLASSRIVVRAATVGDASLVFPNTVLSVVLGVRPDVVLHASAVAIEGRTVAFCGTSMSGKSTLATSLSLAGAAVVTDDALRVTLDADAPPRCFPGVAVLRLRQLRQWHLPDQALRPLSDDRTGYTPERRVDHETEVGALVFPAVSDSVQTPYLEPLSGQRYLRRLLTTTRIAWTPRYGAATLTQLTSLVRTLPGYELHLPVNYFSDGSRHERLYTLLHQALQRGA